MTMPSEDHNVSAPMASDTIAEAIRALVREELQQASLGLVLAKEQKSAEEEPTWQDGFWLLVLIANIALVVSLVPEQVWKNPVFDVPGKILPWVGGGTFVLGATWFRERLLAFSRRRAFKIVMACALVPLLILHVRFQIGRA